MTRTPVLPLHRLHLRLRLLCHGLASLALIGASPWAHAGGTQKINDTGALSCFVNKQLTTDCAGTRQDADFGRDVVMPDDSDGKAGFSFRKVCNNGDFAGTGTCPADPPLGAGPQDWGCTHDRVTKLTWEIKTTDGGVRDVYKSYTNYGDGRSGDTSAFVAAVNQQGMCGVNDWRMPKLAELQGIADYGSASYVNIDWFPSPTTNRAYWSSEGYSTVSDLYKWFWGGDGQTYTSSVAKKTLVRLVRGGERDLDPAERYIVVGHEIYDRQTGLAWQMCENFSECKESFPETAMKFAEALNVAREIAKSTGKPWRIPNIKELQSLIMLDRYSSTYEPVISPQRILMSSTPVVGSKEIEYFSIVAQIAAGQAFKNKNSSKGQPAYLVFVRNASGEH